jgi:aryl-alcohol dehydrogenase-like predicted oxidoreductase
MVRCVQVMRMGEMGVMRRGFVVAVFGVRSGFMMVLGGVFVMLGGVQMMFVRGFVCHFWFPLPCELRDRSSCSMPAACDGRSHGTMKNPCRLAAGAGWPYMSGRFTWRFTMKYKQLGGTGLFVSEICLGAMTFGGNEDAGMWKAIGGLKQGEVDEVMGRALAAGVNFIDTADVYSFGASERLVGQAVKNLGVARKDVVIATKVFGEMGPGPNDRGLSRGHIMDAVHASLDRLQMDHIDLYQLHGTDTITPIEEILRALDDITRHGLVRYVGVSNWTAWRIAKALGISEAKGLVRFSTLQAYYSIAGRDLERELVPMLTEEKLGLMVWSPLAGGLLSGKFGPGAKTEQGARRVNFDFPPVNKDRAWACVAAMREIGEAHGVSVARVALAWLLAKPAVMSVIIGAKTVAQLDDNLAAVDLRLSQEEMAKLDEVSDLPPEYPGWMLARQGGVRIPKDFVRKG